MTNGIHNHGNRQQVLDARTKMKTDDGYFTYAPIVWDGLSDGQREVLNQLLHQGPIYDGNIISKAARDDLIEFGLATRCCYMGESGYTAATYPALVVFKSGKANPFVCKQATRA